MRFLTVFLILLTAATHAQSGISASDNIADCEGAVAIFNPGTYALQFGGTPGDIKDLNAYPSLQSIQEKNSIWCYFVAPFDGRLTLNAKVSEGTVQMVAFRNEEKSICEGLYKGSTEVKRIIQDPRGQNVGLSLVVDDNNLYPLDLEKGQEVMFYFNTAPKTRSRLDFTIRFEGMGGSEAAAPSNIRLVDNRKNTSQPALNIMIRDIETGNPVIANINISGIKGMSALYSCSDIFMPIEKSGKMLIQCDAQGYFFVDRTEPVSKSTGHELVIWLQPLGHGKSIRLEEIEFQPGTSELMKSSEIKLARLKDFLALNAGIKVEIQGHVNATGENTYAAQKLSESRAKRILNFLVENGISKDRLTAKGYGNTVPVYPRPRFEYEEQANRRVEILIL